MSSISCIIVEDEPLAAKVVVDYIGELSFLELKGTFVDAIHATEYLRENRVDLIFLDIHLPKLKGMEFIRTLRQVPYIIITTAYHHYAVEGYELNVTDYLLKPIEFSRFLQAVDKVRTAGTGDKFLNKEALLLRIQKKKVKIPFSDILYIESQREYIRAVTLKREFRCKMRTSEIESLLPVERFKRIHRSFIISVDKVEAFTADMVEINGRIIPVGRRYKNVINEIS